MSKEYKNDDIAVVWKPDVCSHAKLCWKDLGKVFKPLKRPWVKMEGGSTEEIIAQINKCPSGALSYYKLNEKMENQENPKEEIINLKVIPSGPLMVMGTCEVTHADGTTEVREKSLPTAVVEHLLTSHFVMVLTKVWIGSRSGFRIEYVFVNSCCVIKLEVLRS